MNNGFDTLRLSVEAKSGGKNTVILDDVGMPSIMVRVPKFKISEVMTGGPAEWHPMFIVNGELRDTIPIVSAQGAQRLTAPGIFSRLLRELFMAG